MRKSARQKNICSIYLRSRCCSTVLPQKKGKGQRLEEIRRIKGKSMDYGGPLCQDKEIGLTKSYFPPFLVFFDFSYCTTWPSVYIHDWSAILSHETLKLSPCLPAPGPRQTPCSPRTSHQWAHTAAAATDRANLPPGRDVVRRVPSRRRRARW